MAEAAFSLPHSSGILGIKFPWHLTSYSFHSHTRSVTHSFSKYLSTYYNTCQTLWYIVENRRQYLQPNTASSVHDTRKQETSLPLSSLNQGYLLNRRSYLRWFQFDIEDDMAFIIPVICYLYLYIIIKKIILGSPNYKVALLEWCNTINSFSQMKYNKNGNNDNNNNTSYWLFNRNWATTY